jgi:uncharacterized protein
MRQHHVRAHHGQRGRRVLLAVRERARREKRTAGEVLSELARQALAGTHQHLEHAHTERHGFAPLPHRGAAVSNALIDSLREEEPETCDRCSISTCLWHCWTATMSINDLAHAWLDDEIDAGWASCSITENGFVRTISQPRYPSPAPPAEAIHVLSRACASAHHEFWPCDISLLDAAIIDRSRVHGPRQVTDAYLLALATTRRERFATFDRSVSPSAVHGATADHLAVL